MNGSPLGGLFKIALGVLLAVSWVHGDLSRLVDQVTTGLSGSPSSSTRSTVSPSATTSLGSA